MATPKQVLKIGVRIVGKFPIVLLKACEHVLGEGICPKGELRVPGFCQTIHGFQTKTFYGFRGLGLSPQGLTKLKLIICMLEPASRTGRVLRCGTRNLERQETEVGLWGGHYSYLGSSEFIMGSQLGTMKLYTHPPPYRNKTFAAGRQSHLKWLGCLIMASNLLPCDLTSCSLDQENHWQLDKVSPRSSF